MVTGPPEEPLPEPDPECGLVRVLVGPPDDPPWEDDPECGLVRVVAGALADPEPAEEELWDGLVRVATGPAAYEVLAPE